MVALECHGRDVFGAPLVLLLAGLVLLGAPLLLLLVGLVLLGAPLVLLLAPLFVLFVDTPTDMHTERQRRTDLENDPKKVPNRRPPKHLQKPHQASRPGNKNREFVLLMMMLMLMMLVLMMLMMMLMMLMLEQHHHPHHYHRKLAKNSLFSATFMLLLHMTR